MYNKILVQFIPIKQMPLNLFRVRYTPIATLIRPVCRHFLCCCSSSSFDFVAASASSCPTTRKNLVNMSSRMRRSRAFSFASSLAVSLSRSLGSFAFSARVLSLPDSAVTLSFGSLLCTVLGLVCSLLWVVEFMSSSPGRIRNLFACRSGREAAL